VELGEARDKVLEQVDHFQDGQTEHATTAKWYMKAYLLWCSFCEWDLAV